MRDTPYRDAANDSAHSDNSALVQHNPVEHRKAVARLAAEFTGTFGAAD